MALPPPGCVTSGEGLNLPESPHSLFSDLCFCTHLPGEGLSFEAGPRRPCPPMEPGPSFSLRYCFITPLVPLYHPSRTSKQKPTGGGSGRPGVSQGVGGWGVEARGGEPGKEEGLGTGQWGWGMVSRKVMGANVDACSSVPALSKYSGLGRKFLAFAPFYR